MYDPVKLDPDQLDRLRKAWAVYNLMWEGLRVAYIHYNSLRDDVLNEQAAGRLPASAAGMSFADSVLQEIAAGTKKYEAAKTQLLITYMEVCGDQMELARVKATLMVYFEVRPANPLSTLNTAPLLEDTQLALEWLSGERVN
jgi:hypothetical protein